MNSVASSAVCDSVIGIVQSTGVTPEVAPVSSPESASDSADDEDELVDAPDDTDSLGGSDSPCEVRVEVVPAGGPLAVPPVELLVELASPLSPSSNGCGTPAPTSKLQLTATNASNPATLRTCQRSAKGPEYTSRTPVCIKK